MVSHDTGQLNSAFCPYFHEAAELIGRRWNGAILRAMLHDLEHFNEIKRAIPELSPRMLSERLKELERAGLIKREVIPSTPVRTEYRLTEKGRQLSTVFDAIEAWAHTWLMPSTEN
ncbi:catDE operon transcriptional regulator CatR [soil metagenome]